MDEKTLIIIWLAAFGLSSFMVSLMKILGLVKLVPVFDDIFSKAMISFASFLKLVAGCILIYAAIFHGEIFIKIIEYF